MIYNPMVVQGGGEPQWQELVLNGTQDVPMTRAPDPAAEYTFTLQFEQLPTSILFRTYAGGRDNYSVLSSNNGWSYGHYDEYSALNNSYAGVKSGTVSGMTIEGTILLPIGHTAQFLPIYN